jgi:hypothetical protein
MHIFAVSLEMETSSILFASSFHLEIEMEMIDTVQGLHDYYWDYRGSNEHVASSIKHFRKRPTKISLKIDKHYW